MPPTGYMEELVSKILKKRVLIPGRVTELTLDAPAIATKANQEILLFCAWLMMESVFR